MGIKERFYYQCLFVKKLISDMQLSNCIFSDSYITISIEIKVSFFYILKILTNQRLFYSMEPFSYNKRFMTHKS